MFGLLPLGRNKVVEQNPLKFFMMLLPFPQPL